MSHPTRRDRALACLLLVALVLVAFWTALTEVYGTSDDFSFYQRVVLDGLSCREILRAEGRPLLGMLYDAVGTAVSTFEDTRLFRAMFVVGACLSALALCLFAATRLGVVAGAAVAALFVFSPAMLDLASLQPSSACTVAAAMVFAGYHGFAVARRSARRGARLALYAAAAFALIASATIYQTACFVWFICVAVELVTPAAGEATSARRPLLDTAASTGFFAAAMACYWVVFLQLLPRVTGVESAGRVELATSIGAKAAWFVAMPLRDALVGPYFPAFDLQAGALPALRRGVVPNELFANALGDPFMLVAALLLLAMAWGVWARAGGTARNRGTVLALCMALLPMSYGVNLLIREMWPSFRTQLALEGVVAVYLVVTVQELLGRLKSTAVAHLVLGAVVLSAFALTAAQQRAWNSGPLGCEWRTTRAEVAAAASATALLVVPMRAVDTTAPGLRYDLGWPASAKSWGPIPMIRAARQSLGLPDVPVQVVSPDQQAGTHPIGAATVRIGCRP